MGLASLGTFVRRVEHKQQAHFEDSENNTGVSAARREKREEKTKHKKSKEQRGNKIKDRSSKTTSMVTQFCKSQCSLLNYK
jgi:hypothetical protein